jgi:magnesium transporter
MIVDVAIYVEGRRNASCPLEGVHGACRERGGFAWVGLYEPTEEEFDSVTGEFDLHRLAVEDAIKAHQRPKVERYGDSLFVVLRTVRYLKTSRTLEFGEIHAFIGPSFVVTVRHGEASSLRGVRRAMEEAPGLLRRGPEAVLYMVMDHVVDDYASVIDSLEDDIDEVETEVFSPGRKGGTSRGVDSARIYQLKREVLEFKRAVSPLLRPMQLLSERPMRIIDPDIQNYFRDVADHLARVNEQVLGFDDLLNSILQANLAQATVAQNEDMRKITSWAAIFAVPTMIAGIYGMNFDYMPELRWKYGYPAVLCVTVAICFAIHRGFKRNGWL